jgi:hypothetical protein
MVLRMMLGVKFIPHDRFILHRFLTDAVGHFIGSYVSIALTYGIDPHSDRPIDFSHTTALALGASFIVCDFLIARTFGNRKWFGLISLLAASISGYVIWPTLFALYSSATNPTFTIFDVSMGIIGVVGMSVLFLPPALLFPLIVRLMAYPIVAVFRTAR